MISRLIGDTRIIGALLLLALAAGLWIYVAELRADLAAATAEAARLQAAAQAAAALGEQLRQAGAAALAEAQGREAQGQAALKRLRSRQADPLADPCAEAAALIREYRGGAL